VLFSPVYAKPQRRLPTSPRRASTLRNLCSDRYKDMASQGAVTGARSYLGPLECAVTDKHLVLPVFSRNRPRSSSLESTLTRMPTSVDCKGLTLQVTPLDATLTGNTGGEGYAKVQSPNVQIRSLDPGCLCGTSQRSPSHCSRPPLVQQFAKARDFFTIRGNNSAPPGV